MRILNITTETPAATITEPISTPWPIVLGQAVFSILVMVYELQTFQTGLASPAKWAVLYIFNMIRGAGAAIWMIEDIEVGERFLV